MITFIKIKKILQHAADLSDADGQMRYVNGHTALIGKIQPPPNITHWRIEPDYRVSAHAGSASDKNYEYNYFK